MNKAFRFIAALAALVFAAAGCSTDTDSTTVPGVTDTTVTIGSHQPLTGPAAAYSGSAPAAEAYFDYVNDHGGVHGRKIIYSYRDDAFIPSNTVKIVRRLVEQDKVFAIFNGFGTHTHQAVVGYLNAQKVPDLFPSSGCPCWNNPTKLPYTFGWQTDYIREGKILGAYVAKSFPDKKVAYFYQDDIGEDAVIGLDKQIPASQVVARQSYQPGYNDVVPQMEAIARAKADVIVSFAPAAYTALLRLAQQKTGNAAKLVVYVGGSDPPTLSGLLPPPGTSGQGNPLIQGIIASTYLTPLTATSNGWVALAKKIHDRYLRSRPLNFSVMYGVATAYTFVQALQRAGKHPTRESLVEALERGKFSPGPGLTPLEYSPTSHAGYTGAQIGIIKGNGLVLEGPPMTTDAGDGPIVPYTSPPAQAPANGLPPP
ncbi:ABC transporter substrate-binding protein [Streptomyces sp. NBC_01017]|uniref:ABC transporter substrate-binding protein n=1 Tax=Streptomyces sp. NBC_01017 TaxID=2903721 RepID=UPI00386415FF|nr:ABC transporter substrate-binding protein [Streptomyces sp. NBC_01017]WSV35020.1 ABC transporter substrate-binding protein [Streptomyces sp. NBC_01017]